MNTPTNPMAAFLAGQNGNAPPKDESMNQEDVGDQQLVDPVSTEPLVGSGVAGSQPWLADPANEEPVYVYRRDDIREFMMGDFHFKNHVLSITGDEQNADFLRLLHDMPAIDRNHIYVFHPEALAAMRSAVDFSPVQRGIATTKNIPDAKLQSSSVIERKSLG